MKEKVSLLHIPGGKSAKIPYIKIINVCKKLLVLKMNVNLWRTVLPMLTPCQILFIE